MYSSAEFSLDERRTASRVISTRSVARLVASGCRVGATKNLIVQQLVGIDASFLHSSLFLRQVTVLLRILLLILPMTLDSVVSVDTSTPQAKSVGNYEADWSRHHNYSLFSSLCSSGTAWTA